MSITRPALQTLPSGDWMIRRALLAESGEVIVAVDFTAVEMRVLAALADVRAMKAAIKAGADLHDYTAELVYGPGFTKAHRKLAKGVGLATIYGGGAETIHRQTGAPLEEVQYARRTYGRVYPEIKRASNAWQREAFANGMVLTSPVGRRLPLDRDRTYAAVNYLCQSTARDLLGQALINIQDAGLLDTLRLPIHDEVVLSAPKAEAEEVRRAVERAMTMDLFGVRIDAEGKVGGAAGGRCTAPQRDRGRGVPDPGPPSLAGATGRDARGPGRVVGRDRGLCVRCLRRPGRARRSRPAACPRG